MPSISGLDILAVWRQKKKRYRCLHFSIIRFLLREVEALQVYCNKKKKADSFLICESFGCFDFHESLVTINSHDVLITRLIREANKTKEGWDGTQHHNTRHHENSVSYFIVFWE